MSQVFGKMIQQPDLSYFGNIRHRTQLRDISYIKLPIACHAVFQHRIRGNTIDSEFKCSCLLHQFTFCGFVGRLSVFNMPARDLPGSAPVLADINPFALIAGRYHRVGELRIRNKVRCLKSYFCHKPELTDTKIAIITISFN